ncbi:hypothetical protein [Marispirochaeta sp.]|uniref:hypothetical protein n=1 Tax=Marispirochaeta sp. TaxID=2038653 RepID=UPI0029C8EF1E|nr:hypothetical protein [Marispirochaeta sp.]
MPRHAMKVKGHSIVFASDFNPTVFQPRWLKQLGLLDFDESDEKVNIIHPEITDFVYSWLNIKVTRTKLIAQTIDESAFELLRDFVFGLFSYFDTIPVNRAGINFDMHIDLFDREYVRTTFQNLVNYSFLSKLTTEPDINSLRFNQHYDYEDFYHTMNIRIEPSMTRVPNTGIFISINNDLWLKDENNHDPRKILDVISSKWDACMRLSSNLPIDIIEGDDYA